MSRVHPHGREGPGQQGPVREECEGPALHTNSPTEAQRALGPFSLLPQGMSDTNNCSPKNS